MLYPEKNSTEGGLVLKSRQAILRPVFKMMQRAFTLLALIFISYFAWRSRQNIASLITRSNGGLLLLSIFAWGLLHLISPLGVTIMFGGMDQPIRYVAAFRIHTRNLPARYIPGGIWHTVGRVVSFRRLGTSTSQLASFVLLENLLAAGVALSMGGFPMVFSLHSGIWKEIALWATAGGLTILCLPPISFALWGRLTIALRLYPLRFRAYIKMVACIILFWIIAAASFVSYISAFALIPNLHSAFEAGAGYIFSWALGFVAIFSPQGIGVSEAILAKVIPSSLSFENMITLAAGFRIIVFCADILVWGLAQLWSLTSNGVNSK